jgi:hypothetical protein
MGNKKLVRKTNNDYKEGTKKLPYAEQIAITERKNLVRRTNQYDMENKKFSRRNKS